MGWAVDAVRPLPALGANVESLRAGSTWAFAAAPRRFSQQTVFGSPIFRRFVPNLPPPNENACSPAQPQPTPKNGHGPDAAGAEARGLPATLLAPEQGDPLSFGVETTIAYRVEETGRVRLRIYDLLGRHVETLVDARLTPDTYAVTFDARGLASGTYLYRLETSAGVETRRMTLIKKDA